MDPQVKLIFVLLFFRSLFTIILQAQPINPTSHIIVAGVVYCDVCSTNSFSRHSYFLPGVDVNIQCKFKSKSRKLTERITISVNKTTDKNGLYKLEIPSNEEIDCIEGRHATIESNCQATLVKQTSSTCNVPNFKTTFHEITIKPKQNNLCIYNLNPLSYKKHSHDRINADTTTATLCLKDQSEVFRNSPLNSSKTFFPFFPPFVYFPPWHFEFPHFTYPFFPCPPLPIPPSLPFPFPPLPPFPTPPVPPGFNLGDPRTWIPNIPSFPPPPPLPPIVFPPLPPGFNFGDPRTWIPYLPPPGGPNKEDRDSNLKP